MWDAAQAGASKGTERVFRRVKLKRFGALLSQALRRYGKQGSSKSLGLRSETSARLILSALAGQSPPAVSFPFPFILKLSEVIQYSFMKGEEMRQERRLSQIR
ncbi:hypothetical protein NQZ68_010849 [Dissostichus eleginoides]|nr:hypothetical protein NQZ68_010849 [Dissostichus eleginoides]